VEVVKNVTNVAKPAIFRGPVQKIREWKTRGVGVDADGAEAEAGMVVRAAIRAVELDTCREIVSRAANAIIATQLDTCQRIVLNRRRRLATIVAKKVTSLVIALMLQLRHESSDARLSGSCPDH